MRKGRKLRIKTGSRRNTDASGTRSPAKTSSATSATTKTPAWPVIWAAYLDMIAAGRSTEEALADHPEWQIASPSALHRRVAADEQLWSEYMQARKAAIIAVSESILPIVDDGRNDWQEKESNRGNTYVVANHENVQRSRLRAETRFKLLESLMHEVFGKKLDISNKDGSFAALWAAALSDANKPVKK